MKLLRRATEPEVIAGTKSSNALGGDVGSIVSVHVAIPLFDRAAPERAAAQARARQLGAEADVLRATVRAQIAAWREAVIQRRAIADRPRVSRCRRARRQGLCRRRLQWRAPRPDRGV